jgi:hypothetical protein
VDTVKVNYITYKVIEAHTADELEAEGYGNVANLMRENKIALRLVLQRPRGRKFYHANQYESGNIGNVVTLF